MRQHPTPDPDGYHDDEDLEALLSALESIEALPMTETSEPLLDGLGRQGS